MVELVDRKSVFKQRQFRSTFYDKAFILEDIHENTDGVIGGEKMPDKASLERSRYSRQTRTVVKNPSETNAYPHYDTRLDAHQQTYVLSPTTLEALRKSMTIHRVFSDPDNNIGLHGPRRPLLMSYPTKPKIAGRAYFIRTPNRSQMPESTDMTAEVQPISEEVVPDVEEAHDYVRLAHLMRTEATRFDYPIPKRLRTPKTIAPTQTKAQFLAKEKGFILDGIAISSIQDDYRKVQPKLGPAIPPYNSHFDQHVRNYFKYKGVNKNLKKTGQLREKSVSIQGKAVDRFHHIGDGCIYLRKRNVSGEGYSRDRLDGHAQFLSEIKPLHGYNGRFGFRRNTPTLRNCASPFGIASRSPNH